jgi:hypothetical protein
LSTYTKGSVPDELGDDTEGSGDTEEDGVKVLLVEAVAEESSVDVSMSSLQTTH